MEIKVGEYVRTKEGHIGKCQKIDVYYGDILIRTELKRIINDFEVIKHSFNIIDLIEEGDYVNGKEVGCILKDEQGNITDVCYYDEAEEQTYTLGDIKSVVTKEQFKAMEYVIKEG